VLDHPTFHRLGAWLGHFHRRAGRVDPAPPPVAPPGGDGGVPEAAPAAPVPEAAPAAPVPEAAGIAAPATFSPPATLEPDHEEGLHLAAAHRWGRAQRALERATRAAADGAAAADLASVRAVRRQLRVLAKWPSDVPAHLALGRAYFELGLGADAEAVFRRVLALAPDEPAAPYFLALEHAFRGDWAPAEGHYARARALAPDLPPFAAWRRGHGDGTAGDAAGPRPGAW
jgi:tetratricopeptide (TPR) repeat protein